MFFKEYKSSLNLKTPYLSTILTTYVINFSVCHLVLIRYLLTISTLIFCPRDLFQKHLCDENSPKQRLSLMMIRTHTHTLDILGETPW